jgi:hypothetical protein
MSLVGARAADADVKGSAMVRSVLFDVLRAVILRTVRQNHVSERFGDSTAMP